MNEEQFVSRYEQKDHIRRATLQNNRMMEDPAYQNRMWEKQKRKIRRNLLWCAAILLAVLFLVFMLMNRPYSTYDISEETAFPASANMRIYEYAKGNLLISLDSVTYVKSGKVVYTEQIAVKKPRTVIRGDFFALYDEDGYQIQIYDAKGSLSTVKLSRQIRAMDISETGVIAVFTESGDAAYVSYFDRYGTRISVELRTYLDTSGYPMNLAVSNDAQKLLIPYYSTQNGIGESKLVLYDFEDGKEEDAYIVSTFDEFYETNTMLYDCRFLDDSHMVAVGDNGFFFYRYAMGRISEASKVYFTDSVKSVFYAGDKIGVILEKDNIETSDCYLYDCSGKCYSRFSVSSHYSQIVASDTGVLFINEKNVNLYNLSGKHRYEGTLNFTPSFAAFSNSHTVYVSGGSYVSKITFQ